MSNKVTNLLTFIAGITIGSVVTWQLVKKKYEQLAQEEIDSVKAAFANVPQTEPTVKEDSEDSVTTDGDDEEIAKYYDILQSQGYVEDERPKEEESYPAPYVISPDEFQEDPDYTMITFYYCSDGVLTDENYEIVEDVEGSIGLDSLNHFGDYENDAVHVRNERLSCEYEVLLDPRAYSEIIETKPHRVEVE